MLRIINLRIVMRKFRDSALGISNVTCKPTGKRIWTMPSEIGAWWDYMSE
jgi:hypothetical protein